MNKFMLAQEELFQGVHCDVWMNVNREPFMTIQQMAEALEYKSKSGIENIVERNSYLKESEFSTTHRLGVVEGNRVVTREVRLFTFDGIMEVAFLSTKPKAREFRAWSRQVLKAFMNGQLVWKEQRHKGKEIRHDLTDAIKEKQLSSHYYILFTNLAYKTALGFTAKQLRQARGVKDKSTPLDFLTGDELEAVNKISQQIAVLILFDVPYKVIAERLSKRGVIYQTTLKLPEKVF